MIRLVAFIALVFIACCQANAGSPARSHHTMGHGSRHAMGHGSHHTSDDSDENSMENGDGLVGGLEDVDMGTNIGEVDFGDLSRQVDNEEFIPPRGTSHRYRNNNRRHFGRVRSGLRRHHVPHEVTRHRIGHGEITGRSDSDSEVNDRLSGTTTRRRQKPGRHQRRSWQHHSSWMRQPWLAGLGLGLRNDNRPVHVPGQRDRTTRDHHHFNFNIGSEGDRYGMSFGLLFGTDSSFSVMNSHWTKGPNVCKSTRTYMKYLGESTNPVSKYSVNCEDKTTFYTCETIEEKTVNNTSVRNTTIQKESCCHGFSRGVADSGCPRSLKLENMTHTVEGLNVTKFVKALNDSQLNFTLTRPNMTLFVPTNQALNSYEPSSVDISNYIVLNPQEQDEIINEGQRLLEGHMVEGLTLGTDAMVNDQVLETLHPQTSIRINKYTNKVFTANCARLISADNFAKTGVVHVINDVIVQERGTVYDFIKLNRDLTMFHDALANTTLATELRNHDGVFTVFAPTNEAFQKLKPDLRRRLFDGRGGNCMSNVLSEHVLSSVWCGAGMQNGTTTYNVVENPLIFTRDADDNLYVNDILVLTDDYVTENGVVHIISDIMTINAQATDLAEEHDASLMVSLFNAANLVNAVNEMENVTFILPVNQAFEGISEDHIDTLRANEDKLRQLLQYHIVNGTFSSSELRNGIHLPTKAGTNLTVTETVARPRRPAFHHGRRTELMRNIQCATIVEKDLRTCSGKTVVHFIDKILLPPVGSILDVMKSDELSYSQFLSLVRRANMTDQLGNIVGSDLTMFLPTNEALEVMPERLKNLLSHAESLKRFIRAHIVNAPICCSSARTDYWGATVGVRTMSGDIVPWTQKGDQTVQVGRIPVQTCDVTATNGIVHIIDGYLGGRRLATELRDPFDFNDPFDFDLDDMFPNWFD